MSTGKARWLFRAGIASGVAALAFAAVASVGGAVSPSGTPAVAAEYPKKVTICHRTGSKKNPFRTIVVSKNAVPAHLKHGDTIGPCSTATFTLCLKANTKAQKTVKVKGAKKAVKQLRRGAKLGKCKGSKQKHGKKNQPSHKPGKNGKKGKSGEKGKSGQKGSEKGQSGEKGKSGDTGKPAETPGKGGDKGKKP
jgi:hypothetical protein